MQDYRKLLSDYSGRSHIRRQDIPGLAQLQAARPGHIALAYQNVQGGAGLRNMTLDRRLTEALYRWFNAQLADHGEDAMAGRRQHSGIKG